MDPDIANEELEALLAGHGRDKNLDLTRFVDDLSSAFPAATPAAAHLARSRNRPNSSPTMATRSRGRQTPSRCPAGVAAAEAMEEQHEGQEGTDLAQGCGADRGRVRVLGSWARPVRSLARCST
jgi:hypothetical protein